MPEIKVTLIPSVDTLMQAYRSLDMKGFLRAETEKFAFTVERFAKQVTPVKTGLLRGTIGVSSAIGGIGTTFIVQTNVNYAIFVHEGTRFMRARPFLRYGLEFAEKAWKGQISAKLDDHLRKKLSKL